MKERIVLIDDEEQIRSILRITLEAKGFHVIESDTGKSGLVSVYTDRPALVLLDLGLSDCEGLFVLKEIRKSSKVPVLIISVRNDDGIIVEALEAGADDYIVKPFNLEVLLARIHVALRKSYSAPAEIFRYRNLMVDFEKRNVFINGQQIKLTGTEYELLKLFVENPGKVLTHTFILQSVWGPFYSEQTQSLRVFVAQLRKKIGDDDSNSRIITTESGVGYRFTNYEIS